MSPHKFSIGFRSGDCGGHCRHLTPFSSFQSFTILALWQGAPSSWYQKRPRPRRWENRDVRVLKNLETNLPDTFLKITVPLYDIAYHIIIPLPPNFTVCAKQSCWKPSCYRLQTNILPSFWNMVHLVSPVHKTLAKSTHDQSAGSVASLQVYKFI